MHRVLVVLLTPSPTTWPLLQALAALAAFLVLAHRTRDDASTLRTPFLLALVAAPAGALALEVALQLAAWGLAGARGIPQLERGASSFGALAALVVTFVALARARGFAPRAALDRAGPAIAVLIAIGRVGCFLVGCEHGTPTSVPWAIAYADGPAIVDHVHRGLVATDAASSLRVHPVAAYEALIAIGAALLALLVERRRGARPGDAFDASAAFWALGRLGVEILRERGDANPSLVTPGQVLAVGCLFALHASRRTPVDLPACAEPRTP